MRVIFVRQEKLQATPPVGRIIVAQSRTQSVSLEIVARRDDFRGARTALSACFSAVTLDSRTWLSALLWLWLRRTLPYRSHSVPAAGRKKKVTPVGKNEPLQVIGLQRSIFMLLGRIASCVTSAKSSALGFAEAWPIAIRRAGRSLGVGWRSGRLQVCATSD